MDPRPENLNMNFLDRLPPELILSIIDFLPSTDLTCFALCNRRLLEISRRPLSRLDTPSTDDKFSLLARLERDLPEYFACDICRILHHYDGSDWFGPIKSTRRGVRQSPLKCIRTYEWTVRAFSMRTNSPMFWNHVQSRITFLQLKLAMRRFYYGPIAGISTDSLSYTQVHHFPKKLGPVIISLFSREAQICPSPPGLHFRMQDIILLKPQNGLNLDQTAKFFHMQSLQTLQPLQAFELCKHSLLIDSILPIMDSMSEGIKTPAGQDFTCDICNTDSYIEVRVAEDSSTMTIVMTRWFNLGPGLTQDDELWRTHIELIPFWQAKVPNDNHYTNPRFYFEGIMASKSFKELESRNLSYLKNNKYKTFMSPEHITGIGWPELWHTVFEEPPESKERPKMRELKWLSFLLRFLKKGRR